MFRDPCHSSFTGAVLLSRKHKRSEAVADLSSLKISSWIRLWNIRWFGRCVCQIFFYHWENLHALKKNCLAPECSLLLKLLYSASFANGANVHTYEDPFYFYTVTFNIFWSSYMYRQRRSQDHDADPSALEAWRDGLKGVGAVPVYTVMPIATGVL